MVHVNWPLPFQWWFVVRGLGLATINLPTKFEVFIFTHYEDTKRDTNCEKWAVWGSQGSPKVTENNAIRKNAYEFLLTFHSNYIPILHRFSDMARWSKVVDCNLRHLYLGPRWGWSRWNFAEIFCIRKLDSLGIIWSGPRFNHLRKTPTCDRQAAGQTDGRTHDDSIYRARKTSRGKNRRS